jgi:single-stranded DNA-binding protein
MGKGIEAALWATATRDSEVKTSKAGNQFAIVNVAVDTGEKDDEGKPIRAFVRIMAFGATATAGANIKKGDKVYAEGQLTASIWQPAACEPRIDLGLRAWKLEPTRIGENRDRGKGQRQGEPYRPIEQPAREFQHELNDAIPF